MKVLAGPGPQHYERLARFGKESLEIEQRFIQRRREIDARVTPAMFPAEKIRLTELAAEVQRNMVDSMLRMVQSYRAELTDTGYPWQQHMEEISLLLSRRIPQGSDAGIFVTATSWADGLFTADEFEALWSFGIHSAPLAVVLRNHRIYISHLRRLALDRHVCPQEESCGAELIEEAISLGCPGWIKEVITRGQELGALALDG